MNIFYLDKNPKIAAQMHCDKHVVKMVTEYAQMLSTAHRVCDGDVVADREGLYRTAFKNHPCTAWVRQSKGNYNWLSDLWGYLGCEYQYRYGKKVHKAATKEWLFYSPDNIPKKDTLFTGVSSPPPQCMPEKYMCNPHTATLDDTVQAYRDYYWHDKSPIADWTRREPPNWYMVKLMENAA